MIRICLKLKDREAQDILSILDGVVEANTVEMRDYPVGSCGRESCKEDNAALRRLRRHLKTTLGG